MFPFTKDSQDIWPTSWIASNRFFLLKRESRRWTWKAKMRKEITITCSEFWVFVRHTGFFVVFLHYLWEFHSNAASTSWPSPSHHHHQLPSVRKQEDWNKFFGNTLGPNIFWPLLCCHEGPKIEKIWGWKKGKNFTLYIPFWDRESSKPSDSNNKRLVWCWRLYHGTDCSLPHCAPVFQGFPIHLTSSKKGNKNIYSADLRSIQIWKRNARYRYLD